MKTFEEAWAEMEARGNQYGPDALENVRLGWDMACRASGNVSKSPAMLNLPDAVSFAMKQRERMKGNLCDECGEPFAPGELLVLRAGGGRVHERCVGKTLRVVVASDPESDGER